MSHTPLPWKLRKHGKLSCFIEGPKAPDMPYALEVMGDDYTGYGDEEQREADAAFIVRAVNSHSALVEALRKIANNARITAGNSSEPFEWGQELLDIERDALAAIAAAEAQP